MAGMLRLTTDFRDAMKSFFFIVFSLVALAKANSQDSFDDRIQALWDMSSRDISALAWKMPNDERKAFLAEFNKRLFAEKWGPPDSFRNGDAIRIRLGDRELTRSSIERTMPWGAPSVNQVRGSGSPVAIEYLAPHLFRDEPFSSVMVIDIIHEPPSFVVSGVILEILGNCSAFSSEVTNWARQQKGPDPESMRAELRRWWEENKAHFEKEDYKAVKPGRPMRTYVSVIDENRRNLGLPPLYSDVERKPATEPLPGTRISAEVPRESAGGTGGAQAASDSERPIETGRNWTLLAALCAAGAAVALVMRHLLGKKRHHPCSR